MIDDFVRLIPPWMMKESGEVFYSGRRAFSVPSDLYLLGANPGGGPEHKPSVSEHIDNVLKRKPENWSAYRDDSWENTAPGKRPMQRRVQHLFNGLGLDPGEVPASEVVFLRSKSLSELRGRYRQLARDCWPLHKAVIDALEVRVVACLGKQASEFVREQLGAHTPVDELMDIKPGLTYGWKSDAHRNANGPIVVRLSHPSRAIWTDPKSDPTPLVKRTLS